jgi:hypothetical protein
MMPVWPKYCLPQQLVGAAGGQDRHSGAGNDATSEHVWTNVLTPEVPVHAQYDRAKCSH